MNAPGTYNPLEALPTRLGLSMRTADSTTPSGGPVIVATSSAHLGPGSMSEKHRSNNVDQCNTGKQQSGNSSTATPLGPFLEMYGHLMRAMEDEGNAGVGTGATEEPQDLSLHQIPTGMDTFSILVFSLILLIIFHFFFRKVSTKMEVDYSDYSDSDYEASRSSVAKMAPENNSLSLTENKEGQHEETAQDTKNPTTEKSEASLQESGICHSDFFFHSCAYWA